MPLAQERFTHLEPTHLGALLVLLIAAALLFAPSPVTAQQPSFDDSGLIAGSDRLSSAHVGVGREAHEAERIPDRYIVVLRDTVKQPHAVAEKQTEQRNGRLGVVYRHAIKGYSAKLSKGAVESLRKSPNVRYVVPDQKVEAFGQIVPFGIERAQATESDIADIDGEDTRVDVDVAVIDTGVDHEHPDLNVVSRTNCVPERVDGSLNDPWGVAVDPEGRIWIADKYNDRIQEFNAAGEYLSQFGISGTEPGQFDRPSGVATDPEGNVWVADTGNDRVQGFDSTGKLLQTLGGEGSEPGQLKAPWALATDPEGNVWVADNGNGRVQEFSPEGEFLMTFGTKGKAFPYESGPGEFINPTGIAVDPEGRIWVSDTGNNRVQVFDPEGEFLFEFGEEGSGNGQFVESRGIAIDAEGNAWVADEENWRVQKFDPEGEYLEQFGESGSGPGQFGSELGNGPGGLAVDTEGSILVTDPVNDRVEKWSAGPPPSFDFDFGYGCIDGTAPDGSGHGTHVAGTIGALDNDEGVVGVAPGARIWAVRVLDDNGQGAMSWVAAGIDWVTATREDEDPENDIEVANMSLGCICLKSASQPVEDAISGYEEGEEHIPGAVDRGIVVVVAAGNAGINVASASPARNPDAITVAALADYDGKAGGLTTPLSQTSPGCQHEAAAEWEHYGADDTMATFSNWGEGVDIAAPGVCVYSTFPGGEYAYANGTSMASPHGAGAAALLASQSSPDSKEDVEAIRDVLVEEAPLDLDYTAPGTPAPTLYVGEEPFEDVEVSTGGVDEKTTTTAKIHGAIRPQGLATEYSFEYGPTAEYGQTLGGEVKAGESFVRVSEALSSLSSDSEYHFRLTATNSAGTVKGVDHTFTTRPVAYTSAATEVGGAGAILNGAVDLSTWPPEESTTYTFEYGLSTDYGQSVNAEVSEDEEEDYQYWYGWETKHVSAELTGLGETTVYHYRIVATNSQGTFYGRDAKFRTAAWQRSAKVGNPPYSLYNLECVSSDACMASGPYFSALWWDGKTWESVETPKQSEAGDISCVSSTACMAVGNLRAYAWDGEEWSVLPELPTPSEKVDHINTEAVTCVAADSCTVVGNYAVVDDPKMGVSAWEFAALHWDGETWSLDSVPVAPHGAFSTTFLSDVSCVAADDCFAVGQRTLHWDGEEWSYADGVPGLYRISCLASSFCMAVGVEGNSAWSWDGEEWTKTSVGYFVRPSHWAWLKEISCASESSCVLVGRENSELGWSKHPILLRWDGSDWSKEAFSGTAEEGSLEGVDCISVVHCIAVGEDGENEGARVETYDYPVSSPEATTDAATGVGSSSANLHATIDTGLLHTTYQFEYDTSAYGYEEAPHGTKAPASAKNAGSSSVNVEVSALVEDLEPTTTYHYRVVAENAEGTAYGEDRTFTTPAFGSVRFEASEYPATVLGTNDVQAEFTTPSVNEGEEMTVRCEVAGLSGALPATTALSLDPEFDECEWFSDEESLGAMQVRPNSCQLVFGVAGTAPPYAGGLSIACTEEGDAIEFEDEFGFCATKIGPQEPAGSLDYETEGSGDSRTVHAEGSATGVSYDGEGPYCGLAIPSSGEDGVLSVDASLEAQNEEEQQVGFFLADPSEVGVYMAAEGEVAQIEASEYPATVLGTNDVQAELTTPSVNEGEDATVRCEVAGLSGSLSEATSTLALDPEFDECEWFSDEESLGAMQVRPNSCQLVFGVAGTAPPYAGGLSIACTEEGDAIEFEDEFGFCATKIGPQEPAGSLDYETEGSGDSRTVHVEGSATGVSYEGEGPYCGLAIPSSGEDGVMEVDAGLEGVYAGE